MRPAETTDAALRAVAWALAALVLVAPTAGAQSPKTAHTVGLAPGAASPPARLAAVKWLAGHWVGEGLGGLVEELWSPPRAGAMVGAFRLVRGDAIAFYELMTLVEEDRSLVLRLKHFSADLTGWEEQEETVDFPLVAVDGEWFRFDGLSIHRTGVDSMTVYVAISSEGSDLREAKFNYRREVPGG